MFKLAPCFGQRAVSELSSSQKYEETSFDTGVCVWPTDGIVLYKSPNMFLSPAMSNVALSLFDFLVFFRFISSAYAVKGKCHASCVCSGCRCNANGVELKVSDKSWMLWQVFPPFWPQKKAKVLIALPPPTPRPSRWCCRFQFSTNGFDSIWSYMLLKRRRQRGCPEHFTSKQRRRGIRCFWYRVLCRGGVVFLAYFWYEDIYLVLQWMLLF